MRRTASSFRILQLKCAGDKNAEDTACFVDQGLHTVVQTLAKAFEAFCCPTDHTECLLQAAVCEAQGWLGGGSRLLGRARQLGPHPYATVSLFPGKEQPFTGVPTIRTPFQVLK
jgi:hypothetical protein